ncbi:MAG TPA: DUF998 domain-containing protein [Candidatus Saccharimonadales bacterium]|nr:DUF998 domain-containing protein [Candidatus Saccharimonadales bacterium]
MQTNTNFILLCCGIVGPIIFMTACLIIGQAIPGYSASSDFISFMTVGSHGWMERLNETVSSALVIIFALALIAKHRRLGMVTLLAGVTGVATALFPTSTEFWPGMLHRLFAGALFISLFGLIILSLKFIKSQKWKFFSLGIIFVTFLSILPAVIFNPGFKGVLQRVAVFSVQIWVMCFALYFVKKSLKQQSAELVNQQ